MLNIFSMTFFLMSASSLMAPTPDEEMTIRLEGIPDELTYPPPPGRNAILTATVSGGPVRSAWVGAGASSTLRVVLSRIDRGRYQVNLHGNEVTALARAHRGANGEGEFQVFAQSVDGATVESVKIRYRYRGRPDELDFPWNHATITLYQRSIKALPGSNGSLVIRVGDITGGQVLLSIEAEGSAPILDMTSIRPGDVKKFSVGGEPFVLVVNRLVNFVIGRDFAVLTIYPEEEWDRSKIERLLNRIETSDATFLRNDQEISGPIFAMFLREKMEAMESEILSADEFIERVATKSSTTDEPYRVKTRDGETIELAAWLRKRLDEEPATSADHESPEAPPPRRSESHEDP